MCQLWNLPQVPAKDSESIEVPIQVRLVAQIDSLAQIDQPARLKHVFDHAWKGDEGRLCIQVDCKASGVRTHWTVVHTDRLEVGTILCRGSEISM